MSQQTSPFKFLDAYQQTDNDIFFGRERETEALYNALSGVKHLLVYGPSGAGKTSLVECGLRNQFSDADWFALTIRRGANITASVFAQINEALNEKIDLDPQSKLPLDTQTDFGEAIETLFSERYQPVYLLFDQFEELLISGNENEKIDFFTRLNRLVRYKVPCRVMLIMREEFIGHLSEFEPLCPSIFQHRFRLEKMRREHVKIVIQKTLEAPHYRDSFTVENSEYLAERILSKLPDDKKEIELAHVQVFLGELWERAKQTQGSSPLPRFHQSLIKANDNLEGVLDSFLKNQLSELESTYGEKVPLELLAAMISERHTKLQLSEAELIKDLTGKAIIPKKPINELLKELEQRRILRTLKSSGQTQYEISHDVLALVVGQNLTQEMKLREKAVDIYRVYQERQGFFSQEDLDYMRPYQRYKAYPEALQKRIRESENHLATRQTEELQKAQQQAEQERALRQQAQQRTKLARAVSIIALALAALAGWQYLSAQEERANAKKQETIAIQKSNDAQKALKDYKAEQAAKTRLEFKNLEARANTILNAGGCPVNLLKEMDDIAADHPDSTQLRQHIKTLQSKSINCQ